VAYFRRNARITLLSVLQQSGTECYGTSADDRILLPVQREVNIRRRRSPRVLFCRPEALESLICEFGRTCGFQQIRNGCLSTGSSFVRPEVAFSGPDTATPITASVKDPSLTWVNGIVCPLCSCALRICNRCTGFDAMATCTYVSL